MACSMTACGCPHNDKQVAFLTLEASRLTNERRDVEGKGASSRTNCVLCVQVTVPIESKSHTLMCAD